MADILAMGKNARLASRKLAGLGTTKKNDVLCAVADAVKDNSEYILAENLKDVEQGRADGMKSGLQDHLRSLGHPQRRYVCCHSTEPTSFRL